MKEIKQITAEEAKAISNASVDIIKMINDKIYQASSCGFGSVNINKDHVPDYYTISRFLQRYYEMHGFVFNTGDNCGVFWVVWDNKKEEYYERN
jgi:hypothetical protein